MSIISYILITMLRNISFFCLHGLVPWKRTPTRPALQPLIIFLLGAPGVGKGTISGFLNTSFNGLTHLSYGDLLRYEDRIPGSWISSFPRREGATNPLLPARDAVKLLRNTIETGALKHGQMTWLIDGFPREEDHVAEWLKQMPRADLVLYLFCPPDVSFERIMGRAEKSGRPEDADPQKVRTRLQRNIAKCEPMLDALERPGMQITRIDANRDLETVKKEVYDHVQEAMVNWAGN
ncbi:P-loop containing nucleoside triphosphate hydrolase protein [Jackrogersella minutella]|nr:P-loop containing nucleoside triphosphate hydrolase protein [Jackrogersella minutella]